MRRKTIMLGLFGALALAGVSAGAQSAQKEWRVQRDALACVVEHIDAYLARDTPVVIINMEDCPPSNTALPLPQVKSSKTRDFDYAIVYPKKQLECLKTYWDTRVGNERIVPLPKDLCQ